MAMAMAMGAGGSRAPEIRSEKRRKKKLGNQKLMEVFGEVTTWKEICDLNCRSRTARKFIPPLAAFGAKEPNSSTRMKFQQLEKKDKDLILVGVPEWSPKREASCVLS
ncbi:hypothetical protein SELMODRAFT_410499 [Selaginella moellendorffii]|nr:hypothetical protein SELMODRAFT_410499 [Selaginella moellendorffii]